jgi:hypothetical protein
MYAGGLSLEDLEDCIPREEKKAKETKKDNLEEED